VPPADAVIEHRESRATRWLRERRLRIALLIAFVESVLVLASSVGWFWVVLAAAIAIGFYLVSRRRSWTSLVHEIAWIAAVSQLIALIVPVLWEIVKVIAILVLVVLAVFLLVMLLMDRGSGRRAAEQ
jgi:Fe2+ transport system protein B